MIEWGFYNKPLRRKQFGELETIRKEVTMDQLFTDDYFFLPFQMDFNLHALFYIPLDPY